MSGLGNSSQVRGPMMIAATTILRAPPARIGKIGNNITLPRTVPVVNAIAGAVGAVIGILIMFLVLEPFTAVTFGAVFGGFAGVAFVTYSPLKGESLLRWLGLSLANSRRNRVLYEGEEVQLAIGIARINRGPLGRVRIVSGAVNVNPDQFDERGVVRSPNNHNLLPGGSLRPFPGAPRATSISDRHWGIDGIEPGAPLEGERGPGGRLSSRDPGVSGMPPQRPAAQPPQAPQRPAAQPPGAVPGREGDGQIGEYGIGGGSRRVHEGPAASFVPLARDETASVPVHAPGVAGPGTGASGPANSDAPSVTGRWRRRRR